MSEEANRLRPYFEKLDRDFHRLEKVEDDTFVYKSSDVLVQSTLEVPIIIQWPDSLVKFEFTSQLGDISFGIIFVPAPEEDKEITDNDVEVIEESARVSSDLESYGGSFTPPCEGIVFFVWDNAHDWSSVKKVSYVIEVEQPSFTYIDHLRTSTALPELRDTVEQLDIDFNRYADAEDCVENNTANILFLEDQLAHLQTKLDFKTNEFLSLTDEIVNLHQQITFANNSKIGLSFRQLQRPLVSYILSFILSTREIYFVSKYWLTILTDLNNPENNQSIPQTRQKMSKIEIKRMLFSIYQNRTLTQQQQQIAHDENLVKHDEKRDNSVLTQGKAVSEYSTKTKKTTALSTAFSNLDDDDSSSAHSSSSSLLAVPTVTAAAATANAPSNSNSLWRSSSLEISYNELLPQTGFLDPNTFVTMKTTTTPYHPLTTSNTNNSNNGKRISGVKVKPSSKQQQQRAGGGRESPLLFQPLPAILDDVGEEDTQQQPQPSQQQKQQKGPQIGDNPAPTIHNSSSSNRQPAPLPQHRKKEDYLISFMQKIRSDQQLTQLIEYITAGYSKIDGLYIEKRRIKKLIRAWNATYQKTHGRLPTSQERKGHLRELHEEYQQVSLALKIKSDKMEQFLAKVGLTKEKFEELRNNRLADW